MGYIAENVRRFFHPAAIDEMLSTFLPMMNGPNLNVSVAWWRTKFSNINASRAEHPRLPILHVDFLAPITPPIVSAHALPSMGVRQLLHVRRPHATIPLQIGGDACGPYRK